MYNTEVKGSIMRRTDRKYLVLIEQSDNGKYSAYVPDLPGCAVVGYKTIAGALRSMEKALRMHLAGMEEDGLPIPEPTTRGEYVAA